LLSVGKAHPQALIYPLTVASKSQVVHRRDNALQIMAKMRDHSATLVDQATLVSTELIRTAILWHEQWQEGLEEASKHYFGDHNPEGMFGVLEPLHEMVARVSRTVRIGIDTQLTEQILLTIRGPKPCEKPLSCRVSDTICKRLAGTVDGSECPEKCPN
jgi:phosphatidylinositol kinase/protein kinase (PI-3  family)